MTTNQKQQTKERFISYYTGRFSSDLQRYYDIKKDFGDRTYPFVLSVANDNYMNTRRSSMRWEGIDHFNMFSVSVFFMSMCTQVIGKLYGWLQMENFMRASGWPMLNCGMGGLMHPVQVILESKLYPQQVDAGYYDVLHVASEYLFADFLDFLSGHANNLNPSAYRQLYDIVVIRDVAAEMQAQVALFEAWLDDHTTNYPSIYVKFPHIKNHPEMINQSVSSYLSQFEEEMPCWLWNYKEGMTVPFSEVMSGRVAYYPGSGYDGTLIKVGNKSHAVHSYLYVDYGVRKEELVSHLAQPCCINGYHSIGRIEWSEKDIMPSGQYPLNVNKTPRTPYRVFLPDEKPYCFTEIFERDANKDEDWGARRFAITFLFADGIATYYQLFCMEYKKAPWLVLLQDHGFGGNYDKFGNGGLLDAIITKNEIRPSYVLCADNTHIWNGYAPIADLPPVCERKCDHLRTLYRNIW